MSTLCSRRALGAGALAAAMLLGSLSAFAVPRPPHDAASGISCADCHIPFGGLAGPVEGTATGGSTTSLVDAGQGWEPGAWVGGTVRFTSGPNDGQIRPIASGSSTTLGWQVPLPAPVDSGTTYRLGKTSEEDIELRCKTCHNPTGMAASMSDVGLHVAGGVVVGCGKCHEPHNVKPNSGQGHGLVREEIHWPGASGPVTFPSANPSNAYIRGAPSYDGICESCHTGTSYHRNNASGLHDHNASVACTTCHPHGAGFTPQGGCTGCHDQGQGARRVVAGTAGDFSRTSRHVTGEVADSDCVVCHDMGNHQQGVVRLKDPDQGQSLIYGYDPADPAGIESFCLHCHDADGAAAGGGLVPFSDGRTVPDIAGSGGNSWSGSAHAVIAYAGNGGAPLTCMGDGSGGGCHANAHGSEAEKLLAGGAGLTVGQLCLQCHTQGKVQNPALSGPVDDIAEAFAQGARHDLGSSFTVGGNTFTLDCTSCHNPHVVTGTHGQAAQGKSPVTRPKLDADPLLNPRAMGDTLWGAQAGEKMQDFAARASGTGGWYRSVARGGVLIADQPAVYQPPKATSGWDFELAADLMPDYVTLCLDCHSQTMSGAVYPVNWGQGIPSNYSGNPTTWVTANAPHGLGAANRPYYWGDVGMYGTSGNPDPIFAEPGVTRGRGAGHFMRWPYDSVNKNAGINFVMSCTDCHEAHGSAPASMLRTTVNAYGAGTSNWNTMCNNCHYYYGGQHAGMSCAYASCHEQQSIHRIKKNGEYSGGTYLWTEPSRPATTPEILAVGAAIGSPELTVWFTEGVFSEVDASGALGPADFVLTDAEGNNPRTITAVAHIPGSDTAVLTMSAPLVTADAHSDLLATAGISIWNAAGDPAGPWPTTIPNGVCPEGATSIELNEPAASSQVLGAQGVLRGTVQNPSVAMPGDGGFHGDGAAGTYIAFDDNASCLEATRAFTWEARIRPSVVDLDTGNPNQSTTPLTVFDRKGSYLLKVMRGDYWADLNPPPNTAMLWFWYRASDAAGNDRGNYRHQVITQGCPIVAGHWYRIRLVFDADRAGGVPCDLFVEDQGTDGAGAGAAWAGFVGCTYNPGGYWRALEGDQIRPRDGRLVIGGAAGNPAHAPFYGEIDRISYQPWADYSGVDVPAPVSATAAPAQVEVRWGPMDGATGYNLYWDTATGVGPATGTRIASVSSPFVHDNRTDGATYFYVVTALGPWGESAPSAEVQAMPVAAAPPSPPDPVTAVALNKKVQLDWSAVPMATSYDLYWDTAPGVTPATGQKIAAVSPGFHHAGRANGTTYYYILTSVNVFGASAQASVEVSATPTSTP